MQELITFIQLTYTVLFFIQLNEQKYTFSFY